jgi:succinoglycan biosynthesis transport protein ExoP
MFHALVPPRPHEISRMIGTRLTAGAFALRAIRRQWPLVLILFASALALAGLYLALCVPIYTARASVLIDRAKLASPGASPSGAEQGDAAMVETEIEILQSRKVSRAVIDELALDKDPELTGAEESLFGLRHFGQAASGEALGQAVLESFEAKRSIARLGQSHVIEIEARSSDPAKAARIANAIAEHYIASEIEARFEAMRRTSAALQNHLDEMRARSAAEQAAAQDFREKNEIAHSSGRLMDEQVSQLNSQLILAQALTAEAKARYDRIRDIMRDDVPDASIADVFKNDIIVRLRAQYLDMAAREALWAQKYGQTHASVVAQRAQMREVLRSIKDEMRKIEEAYKSDYEIAQAREQSLADHFKEAMARSRTGSAAQIELNRLEGRAEAAKSLHDALFKRYLESVGQRAVPLSEARLISPAEVPRVPSFPRRVPILLFAGGVGLALGLAGAALREKFDGTFRSSDDVSRALGLSCLAILPRLRLAQTEVEPPQEPAIGVITPSPRSLLDHVLKDPFSQFSEALRAVKMSLDLATGVHLRGSAASAGRAKVIGFVSSLPNEGKSTIAANFAELAASGGARTILIDADLRNPALSSEWADGRPGLADVLAGQASLDEIILRDARSGLFVLASGQAPSTPHTREWLAAAPMNELIEDLRAAHDYVIVDLPPLVPVVDARATGHFIDRYIFVVEWGLTRIESAKAALAQAPELKERLLGVVVNKAEIASLKRYERDFARFDHAKYAARYGPPEARKAQSRKDWGKDQSAI